MTRKIAQVAASGTAFTWTPFAGLVVERYIVEDDAGIDAATRSAIQGQPVENTGGTFPVEFGSHPLLPGYLVRQIVVQPIDEFVAYATVRYTIDTRNRVVQRGARSIPSINKSFQVPYFTKTSSGVGPDTWSNVKFQSIRRPQLEIVLTRFVTGQSLDDIQLITAQNLGRLFPVGPGGSLAIFEGAPSTYDQNRGEAVVRHRFLWSAPFKAQPAGTWDGLDVDLPFLPSLHEYVPVFPRRIGSQWTAPEIRTIPPANYADVAEIEDIPWL